MTKKAAAALVSVTIWGNHTHKGKAVEPGTDIQVTAVQAAFLKAHGTLTKPTEGET